MLARKFAEGAMDCFLECSELIDQVVRHSKEICDEEVAEDIRNRLRRAMGLLLIKIANPIDEEYPDLYPEQLRPAEENAE